MRRVLWLSFCLLGCQSETDPTSGSTFPFGSPSSQSSSQRPPLWGSSVLALSDTQLAVADTEADTVHLVTWRSDENTWSSRAVSVGRGSEPTRMTPAGPDRIAVVLRGTGQVAVINTSTQVVAWKRSVCSEPRGVAWDAREGAASVACASGELLTVGETSYRSITIGEELRDVLWVQGALWVTTFRTAQLLEVNPQDGTVLTRLAPPATSGPAGPFVPRVAWRTVTDGKIILMSHQLHYGADVNTLAAQAAAVTPPYYGANACASSAVGAALTAFDPIARTVVGTLSRPSALPVDVAFDGENIAVVSAGSGDVEQYTLPEVSSGSCFNGWAATSGLPAPVGVALINGTAAVFDRSGWFGIGATGPMDGRGLRPTIGLDTGREVFHKQSPSGVACASCHAEGYDDGHVWQFGTSRVRTQSLEGGLLATAPYHWEGELATIPVLLDETLVKRMGGAKVTEVQADALGRWLDAIPARSTGTSSAQGEKDFMADGCTGCHSGAAMTNSATVDVGTGGTFQVPSLRAVSWRGPWLHDGCAQTLAERFSAECGAATHAPVPPEHVADLVEYLKSL